MLGRPSVGGRGGAAGGGGGAAGGGKARGGGGGKEHYAFPVLEHDELMACLGELGIHVTDEDFTRCRPTTVRYMYEQLLQSCLDVGKEELTTPKYFGLPALEHRELHDESLPAVHFVQGMTKLLKAAGVPQGLTLAELTKPDLRVVRRNLSALINFHKFRDERLAVYQEHSQEHRRLEEERAAADRAGEELERRLAELTARRAAERPGEERVRQECMSLTAEIEALNTQQAQLRALTTQHKASLLASRDKVSSLQFEVLTAREEADAVARAVVPNVEEVKEEVLRAEAAADEERAAGHEAERRLRDIKVRLDLVGRCEADVETSRTLVLEAGAELAKVDDAQAQLRSALAEAESAKAARAEAATAEEHARKALVRLEDRLAALRRSEEDKRSKGEMELRADKAELERVRLEIDALRSAKDAGDERIRSEHALDAADEKKHLAAMGEMQLEYDRLCAALATYHKKLFEHAARANGL